MLIYVNLSLMNVEAVIFDFGRTLFDPNTCSLFPNTIKTLENLVEKDLKLGLLSVAETEDVSLRFKELEDLNLSHYFQSVDVVPRSTVGKDFTKILVKLGMEKDVSNCLIVGDNLKREIEAGNKIGAFTVWTKQNFSDDWKPQNEMQIPKAIINNIEELVPLIERLNT